MKKRLAACLLALAMALSMAGCAGGGADNKVLIYSSVEEYRNEFFQEELNRQFPDYQVVIEYMPSGNQAAKLLAEGTQSECDISYDLEYGYVDKLRSVLADLSAYDTSQYVEDLVDPGMNVLPGTRNGGCIAINRKMLEDKGLPVPTSYQDLLKPEYKGLILSLIHILDRQRILFDALRYWQMADLMRNVRHAAVGMLMAVSMLMFVLVGMFLSLIHIFGG